MKIKYYQIIKTVQAQSSPVFHLQIKSIYNIVWNTWDTLSGAHVYNKTFKLVWITDVFQKKQVQTKFLQIYFYT